MLNVKKLLTKILSQTPVFEYVGNMNQIHWSSWTATDDGIILADIGFITGGGTGYYYVKDNTANFDVLKITTSNANGTQQTRCFPVIKGHTYQVSNYDRVNGSALIFHFYKIKLGGGYSLKVFSRLAERRWEYAESKETKHQDIRESSASGYILKTGNATCIRTKCDIHRYKHTEWSNCQGGLSDKSTERELGGQWNHYIQQYNSGSSLPQYGKFGNKRVIRSSGILHDIAISERGWSCA